MKASEFRKKSEEELNVELQTIYKKQFEMRMRAESDQEVKTHLFKQNRRNVARIKTILNEKAGN